MGLNTSHDWEQAETAIDSLLKPTADTTEEVGSGAEPLPIDSLSFVKAYMSTVDQARDTVIQEMEGMVVNGLADLVSCPAAQNTYRAD